jgi:molecular chaperone DnaJ
LTTLRGGAPRAHAISRAHPFFHAPRYHPDLNKDEKNAAAKFHEVQSAYDVLSDDSKRAAYDAYGHAGVEAEEAGGGGGGGGRSPFGGGGGEEFMGAEELFNRMFQEMSGMGGGRARGGGAGGRAQGGDVQALLNVSFMEAVSGCTKSVSAPVAARCEPCKGSGSSDGKDAVTCTACKGLGQTVVQSGMMMMTSTCRKCGGAGSMIKNPCRNCGGAGVSRKPKTVQINVPAGVDTGMNLRLSGEGDAGERGGAAGHFFVRVAVEDDPYFKREGSDIHVDLPISFTQAALGATVAVPTVKGEAEVAIPAGSQPGDRITLRGKGVRRVGGMPSSGGNQIVHLRVEVPRSVTAKQRELLTALGEEDGKGGGTATGGFTSGFRSILEATLRRVRGNKG